VLRGVGCGGGGWVTSPEKNHFCPQNDKTGCILMQFLTSRKHRPSWFNYEKKPTKTVQNYPKKFLARPGDVVAPSPSPKYTTALICNLDFNQ